MNQMKNGTWFTDYQFNDGAMQSNPFINIKANNWIFWNRKTMSHWQEWHHFQRVYNVYNVIIHSWVIFLLDVELHRTPSHFYFTCVNRKTWEIMKMRSTIKKKKEKEKRHPSNNNHSVWIHRWVYNATRLLVLCDIQYVTVYTYK